MKALVHEDGQLKIADMPEPAAKKGEVVVAVHYAGLNRRDLMIPSRRKDSKEALILGSDGAGVICSVGEGVEGFQAGDEVIINPALGWFDKSPAPPEGFEILGMPDHGTFAEKIAISAEQIEKKPAHLSMEEASVVALSGLTGYRALFTQGNLQKGETVFIPGGSSGVATFLIQFAKDAGARVITTSRSAEKREQAARLGADRVLDTDSDWAEELKDETVDLIIESVGRATFNRSLGILKSGGRMVVFGATTEDEVELDLRNFFYGQYQLFGSTMGSREELREMLRHLKEFQTKPVIDRSYQLKDGLDAFTRLKESGQFGKLLLKVK